MFSKADSANSNISENTIENSKEMYITAPNISAIHGFTTRFGGVSSGYLSSLNLGEHRGDSEENVRENYRRLCSALGAPFNRMVFSHQVHKDDVRAVTSRDIHELFKPVPYEADGLVTNERDLLLVVFTADCIPLLLWDRENKAIGAVHCGWRSTVMDIAGNAVTAMVSNYGCSPSSIMAAIGPGISKCCFETGSDVPEAVLNVLGDKGREHITSLANGKFKVDLKGVNRSLLIAAGIPEENIYVSPECTVCSHDKYWSHRVTKGVRGSQASVIMLKGADK